MDIGKKDSQIQLELGEFSSLSCNPAMGETGANVLEVEGSVWVRNVKNWLNNLNFRHYLNLETTPPVLNTDSPVEPAEMHGNMAQVKMPEANLIVTESVCEKQATMRQVADWKAGGDEAEDIEPGFNELTEPERLQKWEDEFRKMDQLEVMVPTAYTVGASMPTLRRVPRT